MSKQRIRREILDKLTLCIQPLCYSHKQSLYKESRLNAIHGEPLTDPYYLAYIHGNISIQLILTDPYYLAYIHGNISIQLVLIEKS